MSWIRHGDVILERVEKTLGVQSAKNNVVLAEGEVTGHFHRLKGKNMLVSEFRGNKFLELKDSADLVHEEHDTLKIPEGKYKVMLQREVDLKGELRQVLD